MATVVQGLLDQLPQLPSADIEDLIVGCAQPAGEQGYNLARNVSLLSGLPEVPGVTVNRYCASSLQAIRMAHHAIQAGEADAYIAAGVETVSRFHHGIADTGPHNPLVADAQRRTEERASGGHGTWTSAIGLPDFYISMGQTAENVGEFTGVSRQQMDEFAVMSHQKALTAQDAGLFANEIVPVKAIDGTFVASDDGPRRGTTTDVLAELRPAFRPDGAVTAGNSCPLNDGAAATVIMSSTRAAELQIRPRARIIASAVSALDPEIMGLGPVRATEKVLAAKGMTIKDIDLVEINEAFAAQVIPSAEKLGVDWEKLNVHGGAIALGHPFGATGARLVTTMVNALETRDQTLGLVTLCVGGGQGMAMLIERLP
jgi:acetyl-CoA C-acetyltransferase